MAVLSVVPGGVTGSVDGFEVGYVTEDGAPTRVPVAEVWVLALESAQLARRFTSYKGQRNLPGWLMKNARS